MKNWLKNIEYVLGTGADLAGVLALIGAIYTFVYPANVASFAADFRVMVDEASQDLNRVATATENVDRNTRATASNTARLASAIPNWVTFNGSPYIEIYPQLELPVFTQIQLHNQSPFQIDLKITAKEGGRVLGEESLIIMPSEMSGLTVHTMDTVSEIVYCLKGKSVGFTPNVMHERRVYRDRNLVEAEQSFEEIAGCN